MRRTMVAALCLAAGLTGCGGGGTTDGSTPPGPAARNTAEEGKPAPAPEPFAGLTGGQIAEKAFAATTGASSLRMQGDVPDDAGGGAISIDMALNKRGECAGTVGIAGKGEAELVRTGDTVYLKYDAEFLRSQSEGEPKESVDAAVALLAGKWTKMSATGPDAEDLAGFCDLGEVFGGARTGDADAARGRTTTVDGTPAITLTSKDGDDRYTLYVATEGEPYLLRFDSASAAEPGSLTFGDYDEPVPVRKPAGDILDLDALG